MLEDKCHDIMTQSRHFSGIDSRGQSLLLLLHDICKNIFFVQKYFHFRFARQWSCHHGYPAQVQGGGHDLRQLHLAQLHPRGQAQLVHQRGGGHAGHAHKLSTHRGFPK